MPTRGPYHKLGETDRARALSCLDAGMGSRKVARRFRTSHQTVNRIRQRYRQTGQFKDRHTAQEDQRSEQGLKIAMSPIVSPEIVSWLSQKRIGVFMLLEVGKPFLSQSWLCVIGFVLAGSSPECLRKIQNWLSATEILALSFSRAHVGWNNAEWRRVMSSDESKFYLRRVDGRKRVWWRRGQRHVEATVVPRVAFEGGGVMVWVGVSANARTDLVFVDGNLNGQRYINEVLTPRVLLFPRQMPDSNPIFQDDSARPHRARIVDDYLRANNVNRMNWPAMSPDLSCIEYVWDVLGRAVSARLDRKSTLQDLRRFLREEWARIPQQTIRKLVFFSKNRVRGCRRNNSGYTHYWHLGHFFGQPL